MSEIRAALRNLVADKVGGDIEFDRVAAVQLRDLKQYGIAVEKVGELVKRRFKLELPATALPHMTMLAVAEAVEAAERNEPKATCEECPKPVDTIISDKGYCEEHAEALGRKRQAPKLPAAPAKGKAA